MKGDNNMPIAIFPSPIGIKSMTFKANHDSNAAGSRPATIEGRVASDVHSMDGRKVKPAILTKMASSPGNSHTASRILTGLLRGFALPPSFDSIDVISHFEQRSSSVALWHITCFGFKGINAVKTISQPPDRLRDVAKTYHPMKASSTAAARASRLRPLGLRTSA